MAEEKEEKKKPRIIKRILKWIGLAVISILLIGAVILQVPWKVTTLLVIILAACTILPKPYRKWFWLSVACVVIALIIWVFLPDRDTGEWKPYQYNFDEELAAMEGVHEIPDEENAATIYNTLLVSYDANDFEPNFVDADFWDLVRSGPWRSEDYPEAAEWLGRHQNTISTLIEASKIEKCRFSISNPTNIDQQTDRYTAMRHWAYLLAIASNNDMAEGRINQALEKCITLLNIAKHIYQQPTVLDTLVGIAIEALARSQFNSLIVIVGPAEEHLVTIENELERSRFDWETTWPRILEHEKLVAKNQLAMFYEINSKGRIRLRRDPYAEIRACLKELLENNEIENQKLRESLEASVNLTCLQKKLIKAQTILYWFYIPSSPQRAGVVIDECFEKYYAMAEPDFDWQKGPQKPPKLFRFNSRYLVELLAGMPEESYYQIHDIYIRSISQQRGSQIIIALRRYRNKNGQWPGSLEEIKSLISEERLVDPINNGSFVYKVTEENFTLYSKGKNNIDDKGEWDKAAGADDRLIWSPRSCKDKKEKEDEQQQ